MKELLAASRYAEALLQMALQIEKDEAIEAELGHFSLALKQSPEIEKSFYNPQISIQEKMKWLEKIYQGQDKIVSEILLKFFRLLLQKNRFELIHEINLSFKRMADQAQNQATAILETAVPLSVAAENLIVLRLEKIIGCKIEVKKELEPNLLGGVAIHVRNKVLDGSVRNRLQSLKMELTKGRN